LQSNILCSIEPLTYFYPVLEIEAKNLIAIFAASVFPDPDSPEITIA